MNTSSPNQTTKACPFCAETVSSAAKVCPRCRQWLSLWSLRNPVVGVCLMMISTMTFFFVMGEALIKTITRFSPPPYYEEFPNALQVLQSRMNWIETKDGPRIYLTGILTNQSPITWHGVEFECRFFDTNGAMVDAASAHGSVTMRPNDDSAFRASVAPSGASNDYRSFKIMVSTARNTKGLF